MFRISFIACLFGLLFNLSSSSVRTLPMITVINNYGDEVKIAILTGRIDEDMRYVVLDDDIDAIVLNSDGGDLAASIHIAKLVDELSINTVVFENGHCYSGCTVIFSAGNERIAEYNSEFGFHGPTLSDGWIKYYLSDEQILTYTNKAKEHLFDAYIEYGMDEKFIEQWINSSEGKFYTGYVLYKLGYVDTIP